MRFDGGAVPAQRRRLTQPVVPDVAQVLGRCIGGGGASPHKARQRPPTRLVKDRPKPALGDALGVIAGRRPPGARPTQARSSSAPARPSGSRYLANHTGPAGALDSKHCPLGGRNSAMTQPNLRPSRDILGTFCDHVPHGPQKQKPHVYGAFRVGRGGLEPPTLGLRVPLLYQLS